MNKIKINKIKFPKKVIYKTVFGLKIRLQISVRYEFWRKDWFRGIANISYKRVYQDGSYRRGPGYLKFFDTKKKYRSINRAFSAIIRELNTLSVIKGVYK